MSMRGDGVDDKRVEELLGEMTFAEKLAQLGSAWVLQIADGVDFSAERAADLLADGIGHITRVSGASMCGPAEAAQLANDIQRYLVTETRLGIPAIVHEEVCSGLMARDSVVFPQAIGVSSTWAPELAAAMADVTRVQMRAIGAHQGLSPVLDVPRDARWGRVEETFGEDPYLVSRMGVAFVGGLQGPDLRDGVVATAKHFVGYGASEGGLNWAPAHIGARELREVHLHPFEAVVRRAGLAAAMNGYNELDGVACAANRELLTTILRDEWGFEGTVVSDYFSVGQLESEHHHAADPVEAAALAITAGIDVEVPATECYGGPLAEAVRRGILDESVVDQAVRRVLRTKLALGLFEQPYVDVARSAARFRTPEQHDLARRMAQQSLVLVRNEGVLPLSGDDAGTGTVAVIGPNAASARNLFGDYTFPSHIENMLEAQDGDNPLPMPVEQGAFSDGVDVRATSVLAALQHRLGDRVRHARGCDVAGDDRSRFDEAVALATSADVAVLVLGDKAGLADDCTSGEFRDRSSLDLPGVQEDLARAVIATGTPVVVVLVVGRPCGSAWLHEHADAVLVAWLPGEEGGEAIADVLTGAVNPGGKLPITFPRSAGHVPSFYGHKPTGGRSNPKVDYADAPVAPLHPFGHGLSYTTFALTDVVSGLRGTAGALEATGHDEVMVRATVSNTGDRAGDEVVQLYVRRPRASVTRPVLELKGFVRVPLAAGASSTVTFHLPMAQVGFYDRDLRYTVEAGPLDLLVGTSSRDLVDAGTVTITSDPTGRWPDKAFDGTVDVQPHTDTT